ncbi:MAG TPA: hypothetical protein DEB40_13410 [Elusimicrobia bacterium]|nr:hypothetical protein [Elusimicrobiota bacterium]HBT62731.1 hypothetical protein [Elusimicrobiota bacterium]
MTAALRFCLVVCHFVCPLLFFTNLTRNPYISQICLLNIALAAAAAAYCMAGAWGKASLRVPRTPLDAPWLATLAVCGLSWSVAYFGHVQFFRASIISEGSRNALFLIVNALVPFYLSAAVAWEDGGEPGVSLAGWSAFAALWGFLWLAYPQLRSPGNSGTDLWLQVWDPYGALVWALGLGWALWLCRRGRVTDFLHLIMGVGFLASIYGVCQYFNFEFIWPNVLNPYGGRCVSTFGNPNFLSSYNVILLPIAAAFFVEARGTGARLIYGAVILAIESALLCSMTRSSWAGAFAALLVLALHPDMRRAAARNPRPCGLLAGIALALVLLWPQSSVTSVYTPSVLSRIAEISGAAKTQALYSPWHQRLLIWSCAWLMGAENPISGKGWGLFELFYPFYQGHILSFFEIFRTLRTHANNSHNEILEIWAQTGISGLGVFFWTWTVFGACVWSWARHGRRQALVWTAAAAGVAGMLVDNLLNVSLHFAVPGFMFWWAAGLVMGLPAAADGGWRRVNKAAVAKGLGLAALCAALAVSWYWVRVLNREARYFSGFKLLRQGAQAQAIKQLESSRSWGPREVNAIYELGNAYARAERFADAERAYRQALAANAGYDEIYFNVGAVTGARLGQASRALDFYRMARLINPVSAEVYNSLSAVYLQDPGRFAVPARELLESAVRFFPDNANHWHNLAYLDSLQKRWPEAIAAYTRALTLAPDMTISENALLAVARQSGRPRPPILDALALLRELDARLGRSDYSPASLDLALRLAAQFPEMTKARFLAGSLLLVRGRAPEAIPHLEWVVSREPRHVSALANLGNAYASVGRPKDAAAKFREALSLDPRNAAAQSGLRALGS